MFARVLAFASFTLLLLFIGVISFFIWIESVDRLPNGFKIVRASAESFAISDPNRTHVFGGIWTEEGSISEWSEDGDIVRGYTVNGIAFELDTNSGVVVPSSREIKEKE